MNQLITYNNPNDGVASRRYTAFPLNSTLISTYTSDTIRSIINHAITGKPYTTAVWIRISRVGIQIKAQDPQIARTRIPVFIPIAHVHDIFMQPNINNVICIVYEEVKSNMKGVLLYVVHPSDAHLIRDDFRHVKQSSYGKGGIENQIMVDTKSPDNKQLVSPTSQKSNDIFRNGKTNRQQSPRRILYVRDSDINTTREKTPSSAPPLPQLSYTPFNNSYHSSRDESANYRRHKSPRKNKTGHSSSKTASDSGSKHRRKHRSRSPQKPSKPKVAEDTVSQQTPPESQDPPSLQQQPQPPQQPPPPPQPPPQPQQQQLQQQQQQQQLQQQQQQFQQQQLLFQQQQIAAWQAAQQAPVVPMGIYNRYVPKVIPLPTGEKIKTTLSPSDTNGMIVAHIEPQITNSDAFSHSPTRSRSVSPKRPEQPYRSRPLSAENAEASAILIQSSHHRHHHHHRRHQMNGHSHSVSKPETKLYNTISHPARIRLKYGPPTNNNNNNNNTESESETKQYLKRLIDDMHAMKVEMNKMRLASSSVGTSRGRSDSLRLNLKELRSDIDAIRARMAMTPRVFKP